MRTTRNGLFTLLAIGGYFAWRNRDRIGQYLENRGYNFRNTGELGRTIRSGIDRLGQNMSTGVGTTASREADTSSTSDQMNQSQESFSGSGSIGQGDSYVRNVSGI